MAAGPALPQPEYIGSGGYVWSNQFEPALPEVPVNHPSIRIHPVIWLKHVLSYLGVEGLNKECFQVDNGRAWESRIEFSIPLSGGAGHPIQISAIGKKAINQSLAEKYAIVACVDLLAAVGYKLPTYSSMAIQAIDEEDLYYNVEHLYLIKAQNNSVDLVEATDMTYAGCSFEAIFNQSTHICGYDWRYAYASPILTTQGYQDKLVGTKKGSAAGPSLIVLSRPCRRPTEATESALCTALTYINDSCGYLIGDLHFTQFIIRRARLFNPDLPPADP